MHIPFMCVCIDIVYHIFCSRDILHIKSWPSVPLLFVTCIYCHAMLLKICPRIATPWNPGPDPQVPAIGADGRQKSIVTVATVHLTNNILIHSYTHIFNTFTYE